MKKSFNILGICQGQGTLLFPLRKYVIGHVECRGRFYTSGNEQWKANFGDTPLVKKIEDLPVEVRGKNIDLIMCSCDCGHSSALSYSRKKTLGNPKENTSMNLFIKSVKIFKPKMFLMENLPKLLQQITQEDWESTFPDYELVIHCHSVSEFGNSQVNRKRMLILGFKKGTPRAFIKCFTRVFAVNTPKVSSELLLVAQGYTQKDIKLPKEKNLVLYDYRDPRNKEKKKVWLSHKEIRKLWTKDFDGMGRWPIRTAKMHNLPGVYRNLPNKYPNTLVPSPRQFRPDGRPLTLNDFRSIQGFPDSFKIYIGPDNEYYWFAKALATIAKGPVYEMGVWFKKCLIKASKKP